MYTIAYGVPEFKDPKEGLKIALATASLVGVAVGIFAFLRTFGKFRMQFALCVFIFLV